MWSAIIRQVPLHRREVFAECKSLQVAVHHMFGAVSLVRPGQVELNFKLGVMRGKVSWPHDKVTGARGVGRCHLDFVREMLAKLLQVFRRLSRYKCSRQYRHVDAALLLKYS